MGILVLLYALLAAALLVMAWTEISRRLDNLLDDPACRETERDNAP